MSRREDLRSLLNLLPRLAQLDGLPVTEACRELGLTREELLERMQSASALRYGDHAEGELVDIWLEKGRLCVHTGGLFEQVVRLVPQEALALRLGAAQLTAAGLEGGASGLDVLLSRIEEGLGGVENPVDQLRRQVTAEADPSLDPATLETVLQAHRERRLLRLWYFSRRAERLRPRLVEAWRPFQDSGLWYLHGLDRELGEERVFRLDRIAELRLLEESFTPPDETGLPQARAMPLTGPRRAEVRLDGALARVAREQGWPGLVEEDSGRARQSMPYADADALLRQLLPYANEVEILAPVDLRAEWRVLLMEMRERHGGRGQ